MIEKIKEKISHHITEILKAKHSPHSIALGFAVGTFIEIIPTPGLNILIGMLLVFLFKKLNKYSLFGAMAIWNPLVLIPIYVASKKIGNFIFGSLPVKSYELEIFNQVVDFTRRFLVGNLILAITISITSYFIIKNIIKKYQERH